MNIFQSIGIEISSFFSDPLHYIANPANARLEYEVRKKITQGENATEIKKALENQGFKAGSFVRDVFNFVYNNISLILVLAIMALFVIYVLPILPKKENA